MNYAKGTFVLLFVFIATVCFIAYSYFTQPINMFVILPTIILSFIIFLTNFGEYTGAFIKQKNFLSAGGAIGVVVGTPIPHPGNLLTYRVSLFKRYVKDKSLVIKDNMFQNFAAMLSGTVIIGVTEKSYKFEEVGDKYLDAPEGCIFFNGTLKGVEVESKEEQMMKNIAHLDSVISNHSTIVEKSKAISGQAAKEQNQDMSDALKKISHSFKEISKATQPKIVKPGHDGGRE